MNFKSRLRMEEEEQITVILNDKDELRGGCRSDSLTGC